MHRNPDRAGLIGQRSSDALTYPPRCIGAELESLSVLIAFRCFHQPDVALLDQIEQAKPFAVVVFGNIDHEAQIAPHHFILGPFQDYAGLTNLPEAPFKLLFPISTGAMLSCDLD